MSDSLHIFFILDGSGSMQGVQDDVVGGINAFIEDQKELDDGDTYFSLTVFDDNVKQYYTSKRITEVDDVTRDITLMGGSTALLDAVGKTLTEVEQANLQGKKLVII